MYAFDYQRAASVDEARRLLGHDPDAKLLAGGMTLLPTLKLRLAAPSHLVDLGPIGDLKGIEVADEAVTIRAMTPHASVAASDAVRTAIPALAALAGGIGDQQVRHRGTIGGSIANNDPNADYPAALLALGATVVTTKRRIPAEQFFVGMFETALEPDEIIRAVSFPITRQCAYEKFKHPASGFALTGVFVAKRPDGVRIAVTGAGPHVFRVPEFEQALSQRFESAALEGLTISPEGLNSDIHASAEYRAHLVGVMARRAIAKVLAPG